MIKCCFVDLGPIAKESIARLIACRCGLQRITNVSVEAGDVEQVRLVEPNHFTSHWMFGHCLAELRRAQMRIAVPLNIYAGFRAIVFNLGTATRLEDFPPG